MNPREASIVRYIEGYNSFDVAKMVADFSDDIVFTNLQKGEVSMELNGIEEFKAQAETAKTYFSDRKQTVKSFTHRNDQTEVEIEYTGTLATDLPNGLRKGQ